MNKGKGLEKGQYGYINQRKKRQLIYTICSFGFALLVLITGIIKYGDRNNIFTVGAVVLVLPAAKIGVSCLLVMRCKATSKEKYNKLSTINSYASMCYDMVMSVKDKIVMIPYMAATATNVILYVPNSKLTPTEIEEYIAKFIGVNGLFPTIKVFTDENKFVGRLKCLPAEEKSAERVVENIMILHV